MNLVRKTRQRGAAMIISLIALLAISLASVALMRTVDTGNVVSGNLAFNEAAIQMADVGAEAANSFILGNIAANTTSCQTAGTGVCPSWYYPNVSALDPVTKLPTQPTLNWSTATAVPGQNGYTYQYVVERMCYGTSPATPTSGSHPEAAPTFARCTAAPIYDQATNSILQTGYGKLFYRITVQVNGPRNTRALAQYFYGVQDTVT